MPKGLGAFWSYASRDEGSQSSVLLSLPERVARAVSQRIGTDYSIWVDRTELEVGQNWREEIDSRLHSSSGLIPVVSPSWLNSEECIKEFKLFRSIERETKNKRIFPILLRSLDKLTPSGSEEDIEAIKEDLFRVQFANWTGVADAIDQGNCADEALSQAIEALADSIASHSVSLRTDAHNQDPRPYATAPMRRKIIPGGTKVRSYGPARLESWISENCLSPDEIEVILGAECDVEAVETEKYCFELKLRSAWLQVDPQGADIDPKSCFARDSASDGLKYLLQGEWRIRPEEGQFLNGNCMPDGALCQLHNCLPEAGVTVSLIARDGDAYVDPDTIVSAATGKKITTKQTNKRLAAIWLKEARERNDDMPGDNRVVSSISVKTTLRSAEND